ncbi:MAG: RNA polymerase sigma factor [Clostridia bacterium]|nr:RNA polymerase sigma factor [Clostridia bacterium]
MDIKLEQHYDKIYRYCFFKLHHQQLAEDIAQETFLHFLESERYTDKGKTLAFLYTIARNLCIDYYRKEKPESLPREWDSMMPADEKSMQWAENLSLYVALKELPREERELIFLRVVNEVPMGELTQLYQMSRFALYREIKRILKKLERSLSDENRNKTAAATGISGTGANREE